VRKTTYLELPALDESDIARRMRQRLVGQDAAVEKLLPMIIRAQAGLSLPERPAGTAMLLGPTGTGKTQTVEAVAEALHGSHKVLLKVDCAEYQADHEVAKLIGAPPGYLGHRETAPAINPQKMESIKSERSGLQVVLFDEIEKAAPSLHRLLLGVLDKAQLKLGDGRTVEFEDALIFFTSNLGTKALTKAVSAGIGFGESPTISASRRATLTSAAVARKFSPEWINRIDVQVTYEGFTRGELASILDMELAKLNHIAKRSRKIFSVETTPAARTFLLDRGTSVEYGARELKRVLQRFVWDPVAIIHLDGQIPSGKTVIAHHQANAETLSFSLA
jgi:ATP-dependent Clp protease ATP-binding subunit ClpA